MVSVIIVLVLAIAGEAMQQPRLVYPRLLEERSADGRMVMHLHDQLTLNLRKASVAARNFRVLEQEDGREVTHFFNGEDLEQDLHEDEKQFASVHVRRRGGGVEVEGVVGPRHRIEPVHTMERSEEGLIAHMIHEIEMKDMHDIVMAPIGKGAPTVSERNYGSTQNVPPSVTIELFVVSDRPHHQHFQTTIQLIQYLCVMVNSMNLRYADTDSPRVIFLLTGVEKDEHSPYRNGNDKYLESASSLEQFRSYAYGKRHQFGNPDVTFLITGYDVYSTASGGSKSTSVLGIGYVGGLCTEYFVALGEDSAGLYTGMHTLTHECGHVLGAAHDESRPVSWIKGDPGSMACLWKEGHIMSYVDGGVKHHHFSKCSLAQIRNVVILRGLVCWQLGNTGHTYDGIYPGMEVAPNAYCRHAFPDKENVTADMESDSMKKCMVKCQYPEYRRVCYSSRCFTYVTTYSLQLHAQDYMPCGGNKVCIQGVCGEGKIVMPSQKPTTVTVTADTEAKTTTTTTTTTTPTTPTTATTECRCDCSTTASTTQKRPWQRSAPRWPYRSGNRWEEK
uniref:Salivary gland metalloprotease n=1 Tax=Rhipicephalus microplus TaxID=6941 RepID=Q45R48_RHIMP|nr:salivary gland metalloprotease [Rhipicephalus microplus]